MSQQKPLLRLLTQSKPLPIDPVKDVAVGSVTHKRYYEPALEEKRLSTHIPLQISADEEGTLESKDTNQKENKILESNQIHNWNTDPLGLCLSEQKQVEETQKDSIIVEDTIPLEGTISRYITATSEDFAQIDGISPTNSPPLLFSLPPLEPCDGLIWKVHEPLSCWLYSHQQEPEETRYFYNGSRDITWDTIFHPMSTFQHLKDEVEYYNCNSDDVPVAVTQRAIHARLYPSEVDIHHRYSFAKSIKSEPTLPQLVPTPLLKPSPVLTVDDDDIQDIAETEEIILDQEKQKHYFDMLHNIRGPSHSTILSFQVAKPFDPTGSSEKDHQTFSFLFNSRLNSDIEKNIDAVIAEKHRYLNEKKLFLLGFLCPLLWFYGSIRNRSRNAVNKKWQKRCRLASVYFLVALSIVALVVAVKMAGSAAIRLSQTDQIRAVIAN